MRTARTAYWRWPRVLAHRCGGRLAPENSLAGLEAAAALGCGGVEFDAMLAACGTAVVIHDETLERTTNGHGRVADVPWAALRRLRLRDSAGAVTEAPLPALAQVLDTCARLHLMANVEIKPSQGAEAETGRAVAVQVDDWARASRSVPLLSSFSDTALAAAAEAAPDQARALLLERCDESAFARARGLGCVAVIGNVASLTETFIRAAHDAGLGVACYTENNARRGRRHLALGLDALITDDPSHFVSDAAN